MKRKDTHTLQQVETYCYELVTRIQEAETIEEKKALHKKLKPAERFVNDINTKETNGKTYPARMYHSDDKPMNKEEVLKLIDSVNEDHNNIKKGTALEASYINTIKQYRESYDESLWLAYRH
jgi:hypothetical protein